MTHAYTIVQAAITAGVKLEPLPNGNIRITPPGILPSEIREQVIAYKPEIIDYLRQPEETYSSPLDLQDVLGFPTCLLSSLPLPPTLILDVTGITEPVAFDFRARSTTWRRQPERRFPTFDLAEIAALTEAYEQGRALTHFTSWCQRKQRDHSWCLTREVALQGADGLIRKPPTSKGWALERLLRAIGAKLRLIRLDSGGAQTGKRGPYSGGGNDS